MKKSLILFFVFVALEASCQIKSGPMLGYSDMREALLWVQTTKPSKVYFKYWDIQNPKVVLKTETIFTNKKEAFIAKCLADEALPGKIYKYEVYVNNKNIKFDYPLEFKTQTLWQFRTDPPNFKFAVGSCVYSNEPEFDRPGKPYGGDMKIFSKINDKHPDFMVWGGDNIYLREVDWNSKSGIIKRYNHFRAQPEIQELIARTHNYAIWDDHDYGNNDSDRSYWGKKWSLDAFKMFWANPNYVFEDEGITGTFFWEDCQFFMMDDRWFKAPNDLKDVSKDYFGEKQLQWLLDALLNSKAPFKFIVNGGQIVNPVKDFENMANYEIERKKLLDKIEELKIPGVIFISGDRHHTNLQKLDRPSTYPLYDFTISPLTSGAYEPTKEELKLSPIIEGTQAYKMQNFGIIEVSGKRLDRVLKINVFNKDGEKQWDYEIKANDLK